MSKGAKYYLMSVLIAVFALAAIFTPYKTECVVAAIVTFGLLTLAFWFDITKVNKK